MDLYETMYEAMYETMKDQHFFLGPFHGSKGAILVHLYTVTVPAYCGGTVEAVKYSRDMAL